MMILHEFVKLKSLRDLQRASVRVRLDGALVEDRDRNLGVRGL